MNDVEGERTSNVLPFPITPAAIDPDLFLTNSPGTRFGFRLYTHEFPRVEGDSEDEVEPGCWGSITPILYEDEDTDFWRLPEIAGPDDVRDFHAACQSGQRLVDGVLIIEEHPNYYHLEASFDPASGILFTSEDEGERTSVPVDPGSPLTRIAGLMLRYARPGAGGHICPTCGGAGFQSYDCPDCGR